MVRLDHRALGELRRARRRRHLNAVNVWDALYKVYITALVGSFAVGVLSEYVAGSQATSAFLERLRDDGPAAIGVFIAILVGSGWRSGGRGGPITVQPADVHIVLLAPISRQRALIGPALRQFRFTVFVGTVMGALVGIVAWRRLPGGWLAWATWGAVTGAVTATASIGAAFVASGLRLGRWAPVAALAFVGWASADVLASTTTSPTTFLGQLALRPIGVEGAPVVGVMWAVAVALVGFGVVGRTAIAAAQRRAGLLAQLRFAITLQDIRTVVLLRRLLTQEGARSRPWVVLRRGIERPVWRRDIQGLLRWPAMRFVRLLLMGALAGGTLMLVWNGATEFLVIAGGVLFVAALEAVEGLAEEVDHPARRDTLPVRRSWLTGQHMFVPLLVMTGISIGGVAAAAAVGGGSRRVLTVGAVTVLPAALGAVCGAVMSVISEPFDPSSPDLLVTPELVASGRFLFRMGFAPGLAVMGVLPVLAARLVPGNEATAAAGASAGILVVLVGSVVLFRYGHRNSP